MSIRVDGDTIHLEGACPIEDAEPLSALLQADRGRKVDLSGCTTLHAAVAQALLAFAPALIGAPQDVTAAKILAGGN